ncbi:MAG: hypothetical protein AAGA03_01425 [Planctomycetota bacterium]
MTDPKPSKPTDVPGVSEPLPMVAEAKVDWGYEGVDQTDPVGPSGHARGIAVSTRLTSSYRRRHRKNAVDVQPEQVIECLRQAGIKKWVLMGLHGYVGYLPMPRATQDVDVMVPYSQKRRAANAIEAQWPMLEKLELSQVIRFKDPGDPDQDGVGKPVIDLMMPFGRFQEHILDHHTLVDPQTGDRYPTIEAAVVSKYAAVISPHRSFEKKEQDAVDLRRLIKHNQDAIDRKKLAELAGMVYEAGGQEILVYFENAIHDRPFKS